MALTFEEKMSALTFRINSENPIKEIDFILHIEPLPYARPRKGRSGNFYNPRDKYKKQLKRMIKEELSREFHDLPCEGPVSLDITIGLTPSKNIEGSKTKSYLAKIKFLKPQVRPDIDNYIKPVLDALNKILYEDDGQIVDLNTHKVYSDKNPFIAIKCSYRETKIKLR